jgi:hypothetical protein
MSLLECGVDVGRDRGPKARCRRERKKIKKGRRGGPFGNDRVDGKGGRGEGDKTRQVQTMRERKKGKGSDHR